MLSPMTQSKEQSEGGRDFWELKARYKRPHPGQKRAYWLHLGIGAPNGGVGRFLTEKGGKKKRRGQLGLTYVCHPRHYGAAQQ